MSQITACSGATTPAKPHFQVCILNLRVHLQAYSSSRGPRTNCSLTLTFASDPPGLPASIIEMRMERVLSRATLSRCNGVRSNPEKCISISCSRCLIRHTRSMYGFGLNLIQVLTNIFRVTSLVLIRHTAGSLGDVSSNLALILPPGSALRATLTFVDGIAYEHVVSTRAKVSRRYQSLHTKVRYATEPNI
jgi:hypothetical protein